VTLTGDQVADFYSEQYGSPRFPLLLAHMSSGPIIVMCLSKKNAIEDWNNLIGPPNVSEAQRLFPACLRAKYGDPNEDTFNGLHGSKNEETAEKEIRFFFPESKLQTKPWTHSHTYLSCVILFWYLFLPNNLTL
jgi:nucleoside-diphosphate kinase